MAHGDVYSVGITVYLTDRVTAGLGMITNGLRAAGTGHARLNAQVQALHRQYMMLGAAQQMFRGLQRASVGAMEGMLGPAKEYQHQLGLMNMAGTSQMDIAKGVGDAWAVTHKTITAGITGSMRALGDMKTIFGDMTDARKLLPFTMNLEQLMIGGAERYGQRIDKENIAKDVWKSVDMTGDIRNPKTGQMDVQTAMHKAELMAKVYIASRGQVTPGDFRQFFKYARQQKMTISDKELTSAVPEMIIEMKNRGGSGGGQSGGAGPLWAAFNRTFVLGKMTNLLGDEMLKLGLWEGGWQKSGGSGSKKKLVGHVKGLDMATESPSQWVNEVLMPAVKKSGAKGDLKQLLSAMTQRMRGAPGLTLSAIQEFFFKSKQFEKFSDLYSKVLPFNQLVKLSREQPAVAEEGIKAQLENVMVRFGKVAMPMWITILNKTADGLEYIGRVIEAHPELAKMAVIGAALGAGIGSIGTIATSLGMMLVTARMVGIPIMAVVSGFTGLGLGIAALTVLFLSWKNITTGLKIALFAANNVTKAFGLDLGFVANIVQNAGFYAQIAAFKIEQFGDACMNLGKQIVGIVNNIIPTGKLGADAMKWFDSQKTGAPNQKALEAAFALEVAKYHRDKGTDTQESVEKARNALAAATKDITIKPSNKALPPPMVTVNQHNHFDMKDASWAPSAKFLAEGLAMAKRAAGGAGGGTGDSVNQGGSHGPGGH